MDCLKQKQYIVKFRKYIEVKGLPSVAQRIGVKNWGYTVVRCIYVKWHDIIEGMP